MKEENFQTLSAKEINKNIYDHVREIGREFRAGFEVMKKYQKSVTIFGSARSKPDSFHYKQAESISAKIARDTGYAIITGGGPGIMEAASKGAYEAGGKVLGLTIKFPRGQITNKYLTESYQFNYFFIRKAIMTFSAEAFLFFPGGYGTADELFNILNLTQTQKIPLVPIILVGKDFWEPMRGFLHDHMLEHHHTISEEDMKSFIITDDPDEILRVISRAHVSGWWNVMD
ncbi:MAG: TIGR00730 family Rossman fold protein [Patescibacteria group bacterium]|nr:TIGR00730 family Rossman fold protein [Patescibacteria group bacterium]